jgi:murein DD-endopeptidase MepM/ murein hydrolase activator NlpD
VDVASGYGSRVVAGKTQEHYGFDLAGHEGDHVIAPEAGTVVAVWTDDVTPPWVGYGPGGVELLGKSGAYHVLAHVTPLAVVGHSIAEGDTLGTMVAHVGAAGPHVHWEVRKEPVDSPQTRAGNTMPPDQWLVQALATGKASFPTKTAGWVWLVLLVLLARSKR